MTTDVGQRSRVTGAANIAGTGGGAGGALLKASNLSDLTNVGTARTNLGLGTAALSATGAFEAAGTAVLKANNLSDLASATAARTNLGLGTAALSATGAFEAAGTALLKASNLSDLASAATARTNLGLGSAALSATSAFEAAGTAALKASNLSDLANAATARTNLGLGGAAVLAVGTTAGTVAAGDDSRITGALPATGGAVGALTLTLATSSTAGVSLKVTGDSQQRHTVAADGKHQWGSGSGAVDTSLYRSGASTLTTDGSFIVGALTLNGTNVSSSGSSLTVSSSSGIVNINAAAGNPQIFFNGGGTEYARWNASGYLQMAEGHHIQTGTTTGTKIGTAASQKLGFFNATPIIQPAGWAAPTGTLARTTFASDTATLTQVAQRLAALITDLSGLGLIGA